MIRPVKLSDSHDICSIYNEYILNTRITFEEQSLSDVEMADRIENITKSYPWLVYEHQEKVVGYSYAAKWKERSAYRHSVEAAIYLNRNITGKGIGTQLLRTLLDELKIRKYHSVIYGIAQPNAASIALCEKFGFQKVALFKEVGYKFGQWIDVGYWELILE